MKKTILVLFFLSFIFVSIDSYSQELKWYNWEEGYTKAKSENKIIVLDAYTDWCYWCKVMDEKTFANKDIVQKMNKDFIGIKLNPEKEGAYEFQGKQYSGKDLIMKLSDDKFRGYPTTFFVAPNSGNAKMAVGFIKAEQFSTILDEYVNLN